MESIYRFLNTHTLVLQPTSPLLKAAVTVAIALCTVTLIALRVSQWDKEQELALLTQQAWAIQEENNALTEAIDGMGTAESYRKLAYELLGLVDPETVVIESE